jgi:hypothetical protein
VPEVFDNPTEPHHSKGARVATLGDTVAKVSLKNHPAKSFKCSVYNSDDEDESEPEESSPQPPIHHFSFSIPIFLFSPTINKDSRPGDDYTINQDPIDYTHHNNAPAMRLELKVKHGDQKYVRNIRTKDKSDVPTRTIASNELAEQGTERGITSKQTLGISNIYSGMMRDYVKSAIPIVKSHVHPVPIHQPSYPLPLVGSFDIYSPIRHLSRQRNRNGRQGSSHQ